MEAGQVWLEDANTTEELLTNLKAQRQLREEKNTRQLAETVASEAETHLQAEIAARREIEHRLAELEKK